ATGICGLTRGKQYACFLESSHGIGRGGHVCALRNHSYTVSQQQFIGVEVQFILGRARKRNVRWDLPDVALRNEGGTRTALGVIRNSAALLLLDLAHELNVDPLRVQNVTRGVR